jgi:AGZA family xanthine/uracil permease-like MFS transporter
MNPTLVSPDVLVFLTGFLAAAVLYARRVPGAIMWGILASLAVALLFKWTLPLLPSAWTESGAIAESLLAQSFEPASRLVSAPPSLGPTAFKMDVLGALTWAVIPIVVMFLFMDVFDTMGTLIAVGQEANLLEGNRLVRGERAMLSDAVGTVAGAALGTSTVTSYIESAAGIEQGGRSGLTAVTVAVLFVASLVFYPVIAMVGSYPPITAPALVLVGALMARNVTRIEWSDYSEATPAFLTMIGIPLAHSIADGLALGLIAYPVIKLLGGRGRELNAAMIGVALLLVLYFVLVRARM